jgi:hypothetical protein
LAFKPLFSTTHIRCRIGSKEPPVIRKTSSHRRNQNIAATAAAVESLEGRRLFAVTLAMPAPDTLVFTGDSADDTVVIYDNGTGTLHGSYTVAPAVSAAFGPVGGIRQVYVDTGKGNDQVYYKVFGDMLVGGARYIGVSLGEGDDVMRFDAANDIDMGPNSYVNLRASGGNGNDYLGVLHRGELDGQFITTLSGGAGKDQLYTDVKFDPGSTGSFFNRSYGDDGDDAITLLVRKSNPADPTIINALASGGAGWDNITRTPLAANDATCEVVSIVP